MTLTCAICFGNEPPFVRLKKNDAAPCHEFHKACIEPWLARRATCPLCRRQITHFVLNNGIQEQVLPPRGPLRDDGRALQQAALDGEPDELLEILARTPPTPEERGQAVKYAAHLGRAIHVHYLLANGQISEFDRGAALTVAAMFDHVEVLQLLLRGPVTTDQKTKTLSYACRYKSWRAIGLLLQHLFPRPSPRTFAIGAIACSAFALSRVFQK